MPIPSATNIKLRFPRFVNVDDPSIEFAIEEAVIACGDPALANQGDWVTDSDYTLAIMYYAAHILELSIQRMGSGTGQIISSESTPELSRSYVTPPFPDPEVPIDLTQTIYGTRFLGLVTKNFPPVLVVNSAVKF